MPEHCLIANCPSWSRLGAFPGLCRPSYNEGLPGPSESASLSNVETLLHLIGREKVVLPQVGLIHRLLMTGEGVTGGFFGPWNFEVSR